MTTPLDPARFRELRLAGPLSFLQAVDAIDDFLRTAEADGMRRVLVDVRGLAGLASPDLAARAWMLRRFAATTRGRVKVAMLAPPELQDAERFGVVFARSVGLEDDVFEHEDDARRWLA